MVVDTVRAKAHSEAVVKTAKCARPEDFALNDEEQQGLYDAWLIANKALSFGV